MTDTSQHPTPPAGHLAKARPSRLVLSLVLAGASTLGVGGLLLSAAPAQADDPAKKPAGAAAPKPALTVTVARTEQRTVPRVLVANGNIAAWQEAVVGSEANGLRLAEVRVNVGDAVRRGQVLAVFAAETVQADLAQLRAGVAEAEATAAAAAADAQRARTLQQTGALSAQQIAQYLTAEQTARARLEAVRASTRVAELRLGQTQVLAPDAGVISARSATVGAVLPAGQELFRLIRQGRLEWRAEVPAADLAQVKIGQAVRIRPAGGEQEVGGTVRMIAPTVDPATRNGLVYVDLVGERGAARAGMFARGELQIGQATAATLPQSAVQLRDGFASVFVVGADDKVTQRKVVAGRRLADRIEIASGLSEGDRVVASGGAFLADGDRVRVVEAAPAASSPSSPSSPRAALPARPAASAAR